MEDEHDEQDNKVLVHGQGQSNEDRMENDAKFQDRNADDLGRSRIWAGSGYGAGLFISFLAVNVMVTARGVALCRGS